MTYRQATTIGRGAQLLLLLCTLFGLAAMHTLGHAGMRMDAGADPSTPSAVTTTTTVSTAYLSPIGGVEAVSVCPDGHCPGDHDAMGGWSVCVAVLAGLAAFALLAVLLLAARYERRASVEAGSAAGGCRPPPGRRPGLTIASVSVLRI